ncbi:MAG: RNA 3'-phosphate cyclase [Microcoleus vaginatus WJT46-NPBG5]|jgi:RNA 3'-terminal phosphate cyclase (ATP)|nr:RNA 3'-phosphate cyclase [Microcoleus vaginatus WJT46-NPBG5]
MIHIDGSYGEGGGQVLRTSLSLSAITGTPIRIEGIRAGRPKPGMAAQHLTCVRAAAAICNAQLRGDKLGSMMLEFTPTDSVQAGQYSFDIMTAGAVTLILQTILLPLALTKGDSVVKLRGGTHVHFSPSFTYIEQVYLPVLAGMGVEARVRLSAWGWYPKGGGEVELRLSGGNSLSGLNLIERGNLRRIRGLAVVTELASHIPQRMANRAENLLRSQNLIVKVQALRESGIAPGAGIFLTAEYEKSLAGFGAVGRVGVPAEKVAEMAAEELLDFHHNGAPVDVHLADQLLLPAALATEASQYRVAEISTHLTTNAWVIEQFVPAKIIIDEETKLVSVTPIAQ